ncbi:MAG: hypothetical protein HY062_17195 [Bacteroidetes bacterium]|nr:hypothetical protein [Bacteroidota bacterium]
MKNLNRFAILLFISGSLSVFSQTSHTAFKFKLEDESLPEVLLNFDAVFDDKKVELTWSSNTENNNNFFTVEKSKDALTFEQVTTIKGFGNNSNIISYFDVDYTPYEGISYYRLKQTDAQGKVLSSRLVSINNKNSNGTLAMNPSAVYETPATLMGSENKEVLVVLRNDKGIESYSKVILDQQNNVLDTNTRLDNGTYTVVASSDNKLYSQKVVVK